MLKNHHEEEEEFLRGSSEGYSREVYPPTSNFPSLPSTIVGGATYLGSLVMRGRDLFQRRTGSSSYTLLSRDGFDLAGPGDTRPSSRRGLCIRAALLSICAAMCYFILVSFSVDKGQVTFTPSMSIWKSGDLKCSQRIERKEDIKCHITKADKIFTALLERQSKSGKEARKEYKRLHHRDPPPGFEQWVDFALNHTSSIIDDYGQIEANLAPLRGTPGWVLKERMRVLMEKKPWAMSQWNISRGAIMWFPKWNLQDTLAEIIEPALPFLPDVSWIQNLDDLHRLSGPNDIRTYDRLDTTVHMKKVPADGVWKHLTANCPHTQLTDSAISQDRGDINLCHHRNDTVFQHQHGMFQSGTVAINTTLPVFSLAKASTYQDIIGPPWCYGEAPYRLWKNKDDITFAEKTSSMYWRGSTTGMFMQDHNWKEGHRQRLALAASDWRRVSGELQAGNASVTGDVDYDRYTDTQVDALRALHPDTFDIYIYKVHEQNCKSAPKACEELKKALHLTGQWLSPSKAFESKFVLDVDGNSMSCRFYRLLDSNSLVFKQTIWGEWHDDRIVPWLHYVPVSLGLEELPILLDYFANDEEGQVFAERLANAGREWASTGLRKVDVTIYYYRLLLELNTVLSQS
ncbi:hypothetical protein CBS101457_005020 [Exobasidium rhododendri]|nr:hypothetical protein CBS101457_005020 [Exobasidium rhododendri]